MKMESNPENIPKSDEIHFKKINIFGDSGVGKSSLIYCMENYDNDNFQFKIESNRGSKEIDEYSSLIVEQVKKITYNINENRKVYFNIYETNLNRYDTIKMNLDTLLQQTECIIIMWDNSDTETFDNIPKLVSTIDSSIKDNKIRDVPIILVQNKMDLDLNESRVSKPGVEIEKSIKEMKEKYKNVIHQKISLLNNDYPNLLLEIDRQLNNQENKNYNDLINLVKYKYPFNKNKRMRFNNYKGKPMNIILLGDTCTGKTSFLYYLDQLSTDNIKSTVGIEDYNIFADIYNEKVRIVIKDTAGQERFNSLTNDILKSAHGFLIFFDVTKRESFNMINKYITKIKDTSDSSGIILMGNKIDDDKRVIYKKEAKSFAEENDIKYFECSCKYGINIFEALNEIIFMSFQTYKKINNKLNESINLNKQDDNKGDILSCC